MKLPLKIIHLPRKGCRFHKFERRKEFRARSQTYPSPQMPIGNVSIGNALQWHYAVVQGIRQPLHGGPQTKAGDRPFAISPPNRAQGAHKPVGIVAVFE